MLNLKEVQKNLKKKSKFCLKFFIFNQFVLLFKLFIFVIFIADLTLLKHQIEGIKIIVEWYHKGHGGILADEMGLGKTCQAIISIILLMSETKKFPCLIICPLSVLDHWLNEISRFSCDKLNPICYYHRKDKRPGVLKTLKETDWNLMVTTYEMFLNDHKLLKYTWEFVVFDESQRVKNIHSLLSNAVRQVKFLH